MERIRYLMRGEANTLNAIAFNDVKRQFNDVKRQFNDAKRQFNDVERQFSDVKRQFNVIIGWKMLISFNVYFRI